MSTLTIGIRDIAILKQVHHKLCENESLSSVDKDALRVFLLNLPPANAFLAERFPINEQFEVNIFDFQAMKPHIEKWIKLFTSLPKNGDTDYPTAGWFDAEEDRTFWKRKVVIEASFIPSLEYSRTTEGESKIIDLNLKTDGSSTFEFYSIEDAERFPELYNFKGTWKEAYLLTVKTLKEGWPQTTFPPEFEQFLKK